MENPGRGAKISFCASASINISSISAAIFLQAAFSGFCAVNEDISAMSSPHLVRASANISAQISSNVCSSARAVFFNNCS